MLAQQRRLTAFDLGEDHQIVLKVLDGFFEIGHVKVVVPILIFTYFGALIKSGPEREDESIKR